MDFPENPIFYYTIAYVAFLALVWWKGRKPALAWLDGEIAKIREELDQAKKLRAEAEAFLAECKAKKTAAMAEAEAIIAHARKEAVRLKQQAEDGLKYVLAKHEQHAKDRIQIVEQEAVAQVRAAIVDKAINLARKALAERLDDAAAAKFTDQAIADMPKLAASKAKAA